MANAIYNHAADNHFVDAVSLTSTQAPMTGYSLTTLQAMNPAARVRFSHKTLEIEAIFASSVTASLLAIPVSNLDAGSAILRLQNAAGLDIAVPIPTMPDTGIPKTAILDFSAQSNRTSYAWQLQITSNTANVVLGGAVWLGASIRSLNRNFMWGYEEREERHGLDQTNDYGTRYLVNHRTNTRMVECDFNARDAGMEQLRLWHQDGRREPSVFWIDPSVNDAYLGVWDGDFSVSHAYVNSRRIRLPFVELAKGKPV
jgi:hypothetical protein